MHNSESYILYETMLQDSDIVKNVLWNCSYQLICLYIIIAKWSKYWTGESQILSSNPSKGFVQYYWLEVLLLKIIYHP
jgi:hypothetical protein